MDNPKQQYVSGNDLRYIKINDNSLQYTYYVYYT